jgi:hypothetical protein
VQTARDQQIVGWIARIGEAGAEHVMARFGIGRSQAYARLSALTRDGLLEHKQLLHRTPGPLAYNPYASGSETEIADKALSGETFTGPHYLR